MSKDGNELTDQIELYSPSRPLPDREHFTQLTMELAEDAALAHRWSRIHRLDERIGTVLRNTASPSGLREKILETAAASLKTEPGPSNERRRFLGALVGSAAAAGLLLAVAWMAWRSQPHLPQFCEAAVDVYADAQLLPLLPLDEKSLRLFPRDFRQDLCRGTQTVTFLNHKVRAYQFSSGGLTALVLMVPRAWFPDEIDLPATMPRSLVGMTVACAANFDGQFVAVAIIDGEEKDLYAFKHRLPIT